MGRMPTLSRTLVLAAIAAVGLSVAADGAGTQRRYRLRRISDATPTQAPRFRLPPGAPDCSPLLPGVPELIGPSFDPAVYDQISLGGNGRLVAYATGVAGVTAASIVVLREGNDAVTISDATGDDDQPSVQFDPFGWRLAFRGSEAVGGESASNLFIHSVTRGGEDGPTSETVNLTGLDAADGFIVNDPSLTARTRSRDAGSGVSVRERDARVAFASDADLDGGRGVPSSGNVGRNATNEQQLFVWQERDRRFLQLTTVTDGGAIARPSINGDGRRIAFESSSDLTPNAVSPRDFSLVGNPDGITQIYLWVEGPTVRGTLRQLTWSDRDSFAPRITRDGRFIFFCSSADHLPGGNPEQNYEIFRVRRRRGIRSLSQLTQTVEGDSVFPRPMRNSHRFTFWSTARQPGGGLGFGGGPAQCTPAALLWTRGNVRHVHGELDAANIVLVAEGGLPVVTGPPAAASATKIHFATNDPRLTPPPTGDTPPPPPGLLNHLARATRFFR